MPPRVPDPDRVFYTRVKMYADLTGNCEKRRIKSLRDNKNDCEGRFIYDCFVLNNKADAVYYHGSQAVLKNLNVETAATNVGKTTINVLAALEGAKRYYMVADSAENLTAVTYGTAITTSAWTELTAAATEITPASGKTIVRVVEVDSSSKPIAVGDALLNIG